MITATMTETRTDEEIQRDMLAEMKWHARVLPTRLACPSKTVLSR